MGKPVDFVKVRPNQLPLRNVLATRVAELHADGLSLAAIARDAEIGEREIEALHNGTSVLADDQADAAVESLAEARGKIDRLTALMRGVDSFLVEGFTLASLDPWLNWDSGSVGLLLAGELDLLDGELSDALRRLGDIPYLDVVDLWRGGAVRGRAFDVASAKATEAWWGTFDQTQREGDAKYEASHWDFRPLTAFRGVDVLLVADGRVRPIRLPDDRDADRLLILMYHQRQAVRREQLLALFPRAEG